MTLDNLLEKLGYKGSPQYLRRGDGRFESEPGLGHIFRRGEDKNDDKAKRRWRVEGVYGLRDFNKNSERFVTEETPTEKWMAHFSIHDQKPVNDKLDGKTGKVRKGKNRPRLDIRLLNHSLIPKPSFPIEAKRLYRSDSIAEYMDTEGVGAFTSGYYTERDTSAGMLGYVQKDSIGEWLPKLEKRLSRNVSLCKTESGQAWLKHGFKGGPDHTYKSLHKRSGNTQNLKFITHSLFSQVGVS